MRRAPRGPWVACIELKCRLGFNRNADSISDFTEPIRPRGDPIRYNSTKRRIHRQTVQPIQHTGGGLLRGCVHQSRGSPSLKTDLISIVAQKGDPRGLKRLDIHGDPGTIPVFLAHYINSSSIGGSYLSESGAFSDLERGWGLSISRFETRIPLVPPFPFVRDGMRDGNGGGAGRRRHIHT